MKLAQLRRQLKFKFQERYQSRAIVFTIARMESTQPTSAQATRSRYLIETEELHGLLTSAAEGSAKKLRIVNATWYMPNAGKDPWAEHLQ